MVIRWPGGWGWEWVEKSKNDPAYLVQANLLKETALNFIVSFKISKFEAECS